MTTRWLLLRGLTRAAWHWGDFPQRLQHKLNAKQVLCLDLPGIGDARGRRVTASVDAIANDLRQRWLELRGTGPWAVLGLSMGAMAAIAWAHRHPADFVGLVTINTSAANLAPPYRRFSFKTLPAVGAALLSSDPEKRERTVLALTVNDAGKRERALDSWTAYARRAPVARHLFLAQLWAAASYRVPATIAPPLLVLTSRADRLVDVRCSRQLAARLQAPLCEHASAGHDLPADDPEWVLDRIAEWAAARA